MNHDRSICTNSAPYLFGPGHSSSLIAPLPAALSLLDGSNSPSSSSDGQSEGTSLVANEYATVTTPFSPAYTLTQGYAQQQYPHNQQQQQQHQQQQHQHQYPHPQNQPHYNQNSTAHPPQPQLHPQYSYGYSQGEHQSSHSHVVTTQLTPSNEQYTSAVAHNYVQQPSASYQQGAQTQQYNSNNSNSNTHVSENNNNSTHNYHSQPATHQLTPLPSHVQTPYDHTRAAVQRHVEQHPYPEEQIDPFPSAHHQHHMPQTHLIHSPYVAASPTGQGDPLYAYSPHTSNSGTSVHSHPSHGHAHTNTQTHLHSQTAHSQGEQMPDPSLSLTKTYQTQVQHYSTAVATAAATGLPNFSFPASYTSTQNSSASASSSSSSDGTSSTPTSHSSAHTSPVDTSREDEHSTSLHPGVVPISAVVTTATVVSPTQQQTPTSPPLPSQNGGSGLDSQLSNSHSSGRTGSRKLIDGITKTACVSCRHVKARCNGERPCDRCIRLGRQNTCQDREEVKIRQMKKMMQDSAKIYEQIVGETNEILPITSTSNSPSPTNFHATIAAASSLHSSPTTTTTTLQDTAVAVPISAALPIQTKTPQHKKRRHRSPSPAATAAIIAASASSSLPPLLIAAHAAASASSSSSPSFNSYTSDSLVPSRDKLVILPSFTSSSSSASSVSSSPSPTNSPGGFPSSSSSPSTSSSSLIPPVAHGASAPTSSSHSLSALWQHFVTRYHSRLLNHSNGAGGGNMHAAYSHSICHSLMKASLPQFLKIITNSTLSNPSANALTSPGTLLPSCLIHQLNVLFATFSDLTEMKDFSSVMMAVSSLNPHQEFFRHWLVNKNYRPFHITWDMSPLVCVPDNPELIKSGIQVPAWYKIEPTDIAKQRLKYWDQLFRENSLSEYNSLPKQNQETSSDLHNSSRVSIEVEGQDPSRSSSTSSRTAPPEHITMGSTGTHAYWCSYFDHSSDHRCTCSSAIILPFRVIVNAAFERLFSLSQYEIREMVMADGYRALSPLIAFDSFAEMHNLKAANFTAAPEKFAPQYRIPKESIDKVKCTTVAINKYQAEIPCNFRKTCVYEVDEFPVYADEWVPITEPRRK